MPVRFNIKANMSASQLLSELKGRISGETQEQVQVLEHRLKQTKKHLPLLSIRVDELNRTAIIRIQTGRSDSLGLPSYDSTSWSYVLGVNDEGQYFAHEVQGIPSTVRSMDQLLSWMNRVDEGFNMRLQGDIVAQFAPIHEYVRDDVSKTAVASARFTRTVNEFDKVVKPTIGNHELILPSDSEAYMSWGRDGRYVIVTGREFHILHSEHGVKMVQIPTGQAAVLTTQRGRIDGLAND